VRILLLGPNGQLGWELQRSLAPLGELIVLSRTGEAISSTGSHPGIAALCGDLGQPEYLQATVRLLRPDVVVNAAAYTAVDRAESEPDVADAINVAAPGRLAVVCAELDSCLVHYSTDYVFDGSGERRWREDDETGPLGVYGRTKLEGERRIRASGCRHLILRTSWVYAERGANFAKTILRLAGERDALRVINDQFGAPTGADLLADATAHAIRSLEARFELAGTYHVTASGETSWFDYARFVVEGARARGWAVKVRPDGISPVPTTAYPTAARRPLNSRLDCTRFERAFDLRLPCWKFGIERLLNELKPGTV
jgi:dTDP-4-dehydrorhamnose reductase